jgi:hypothetical protein
MSNRTGPLFPQASDRLASPSDLSDSQRLLPGVRARARVPRLVPALVVVGLVLVLAAQMGCRRGSEGKDLAAAGLKAADVMASYYDSLVRDVTDTWEMEAFNSALRGIPFDQTAEQELQKTINALNRRKLLAQRLAATYQALENLAGYDASAEVGAAAASLGDAMSGIPGLPGGIGNPSGLFSAAGGQLAAWKQTRDVRKGAEALQGSIESINALFQKELPAYQSIPEERQNKATVISDYLIRNKLVAAWPLLDKVPDALGLKWTAGRSPVEDEKAVDALVALARVRLIRMAMLSSAAGTDISESLQLLLASQRQFLGNQAVDLAALEASLQKSSSYLDEIAKLRAQPE